MDPEQTRPRENQTAAATSATADPKPRGDGLADVSALTLKGAECGARRLESWGVRTLFAYPGTSELPLCEEIVRLGATRLVNARGDAEAVFLAGGANLDGKSEAACLLHGARGATNAVGAVGDLKRNEVPLVVLVGLPSTASARYLPPHGEPDLIRSLSPFAKWSCEVAAPTGDAAVAASAYLDALSEANERAFSRPQGPCLVGLPQDVLAAPWIPQDLWLGHDYPAPSPATVQIPDEAVAMASACQRPVVFFDDYFLRYPGAHEALTSLGETLEAPILQVRYSRGPMLFESLPAGGNRYFAGRYDPGARRQVEMLAQADFLITLEDRNMYPRVVGPLFGRYRVAFTSDLARTAKNDYLRAEDDGIQGDVVAGIRGFVAALGGGSASSERRTWRELVIQACAPSPPADPFHEARRAIAATLADELALLRNPVLVDDSQMFGGLLAEHYDLFPPTLRVFGDHAGFVGAGPAVAAGAALGNPDWDVICCLGDHALTNGVKGMFAAVEEGARVTYIVCNNGGSVSLAKQADADHGGSSLLASHPLLANLRELDYGVLSAALGLAFHPVEWEPHGDLKGQALYLGNRLRQARASALPTLVELRLPNHPEFWGPVWKTRGVDESRLDEQTSAGLRPGGVQ